MISVNDIIVYLSSKASLKIGRVGVEPTYEYLIRVSDATGLPSAPNIYVRTVTIISSISGLSTLELKLPSFNHKIHFLEQ